ncbi:hypothetical protein WJX73_002155 [Symbiochloris irregularis]|uniref:TLC domain-containing protein n=1 Tax=Symbiochloris irregularis TaxID=706552 RepID=A0AAW1Q0N6_9CHLO
MDGVLDLHRWHAVVLEATKNPVHLLDTTEGGYILGVLLAVVLPCVRFVLDRTIFGYLGRKCIYVKGKAPTKAQQFKVYKWKESSWKATAYTCLTLLAFLASYKERFFYDTRYFWIGCTQFPPCNYIVPRGVRLLYASELAFYLQAVPSLIWWEVRRKDFAENMIHHFATLGLIIYSYQVNFMKVGNMVFLCHDINDVFMESAKMAKYTDAKTAPNVIFGFFTLTWVLSRLVYFPLFVIRSVWSEPIEIVAKVYNINPHPHHEIFLFLLSVLFCLHLYWTVLISQILTRLACRTSAFRHLHSICAVNNRRQQLKKSCKTELQFQTEGLKRQLALVRGLQRLVHPQLAVASSVAQFFVPDVCHSQLGRKPESPGTTPSQLQGSIWDPDGFNSIAPSVKVTFSAPGNPPTIVYSVERPYHTIQGFDLTSACNFPKRTHSITTNQAIIGATQLSQGLMTIPIMYPSGPPAWALAPAPAVSSAQLAAEREPWMRVKVFLQEIPPGCSPMEAPLPVPSDHAPPQGLITAADLNSGAVLGTGMLDPTGEVVLPVNASHIHMYNGPAEYTYITATYSGDGYYAASSTACPDQNVRLSDLLVV